MAEEQRFVGRNAREVFAKVRQALGRDAVIIEQHNGDGYVEIIASADFPEPDPAATLNDAFVARLAGLGYHDEFMTRLPQGLSSWEAVAAALPATLSYAVPGDPLQGVYRFVGAPGVGKTTTIIKLAADQVLRHGPSSCALISADTRRLAGCEQLALSAELLNVDFQDVRDGELNAAIAAHRDKRLVLIDTAGFSFGQRILAPCEANDVLVVPAMWQANALRRIVSQLSGHSFVGAAITHVDQAETLGACFGVLADWQLPLCWISRGPELPDDLEPATPDLVAALMLQGIDRSQMSATFA
ncbi:MAG: hypothetical protein OES38_18470 [Gammaproteobacteria bacterium]|nr:hypothetical protein [Gammaproteobacteria bacterium]